ncbi:MAG: uracil-DNA glycosylase [Thermoleophilaceae bacterium]
MSARPAAERRADLLELYRRLDADWVCPLKGSRTSVVFGSGNADADLMFVGEAPGANEDREGKPFVGRAGGLLDTLLLEIGFERADAFIANVLKCRPPGNRDPLPHEIEECTPHLIRQVELIEPKVICTLGNFALKLLSGSPQGITRAHGTVQTHEMAGRAVWLFPLFHPSVALRAPAVLELLRADFARLPGLLRERMPPSPADERSPDEGIRGSPADTGGDQLGLFG